MKAVEAPERRAGMPKWLIPTLGYGVAAVALVWVFSKFPFGQLVEHLRTLDWWWVGVAVAIEALVYIIEAWRWMVLLRPVGAPRFGTCVQSVYVGLFANDILPARAGEVIRCFLLSYKTGVPLPLALTSDFIMRIMDGVWVVIIYLLVTFQIGNHVAVDRVMWVFAAIILPVAGLILLVLFHRQRAHSFVNQPGWAARFGHLLAELHRLGNWRELGIAMAIGSLYWIAQIAAIWAITRADGFYYSAADMAYLAVVKTVGTLIPNAPANVGAFQAATIVGLAPSLTDPEEAKVLSQIIFAFMTLPLVVGGAIATASAGFNLGELRRRAEEAHSASKATPPA
jgi:uncharacterized membrane protein YbhN (UPF0104 family)